MVSLGPQEYLLSITARTAAKESVLTQLGTARLRAELENPRGATPEMGAQQDREQRQPQAVLRLDSHC